VDFYRTKDLKHVRTILVCPRIYSQMGDDYAPEPEDFTPNQHPDIWYLVAGRSALIGLFCLVPQNRVCWEVHVALLPFSKTKERWEAARGLAPWLAQNTPCKRLVASVPSNNWPAIVYGTHGMGMRYVGRHERAFMKEGQLQDLVILGRSIGG